MQHIHVFSPSHKPIKPYISSTTTSSSSLPRRRLLKSTSSNNSQTLTLKPNLKKLTSRVVELTRRRQLHQIFEEVELAKRRYGKLNTIVMNAVLEACVHCGDVDSALRVFDEMSKPESCGVDNITFATLLKGLGEARRIDEAFHLLESMERGNAAGSPKLSPTVIFGLLNSLVEAGDLRRASGLLARYRYVLHEGGPSVLMYNLLMKGYINSGSPQDALTVHDEMLSQGLKPDRLTYNTLVFACVKSGKMDAAMQLFAEMKDGGQTFNCHDIFPDAVTYTTLLKGFRGSKDLLSLQTLVIEMKSSTNLIMDRIAYTTIVDALLSCGSTRGALCIFGEILKQAGSNPQLRPKPHLYLSMMRTFAVKGDYSMVKNMHSRMFPDTAGVITPAVQVEADELLMEAAVNSSQVDVARQILTNIITKWERIAWTSRGSEAAVRVEALSGFTRSTLTPYLLPQVSVDDPINNIMTTFEEAQPLHANLVLENVVMRFFKDDVVPIIDDWGSCIGLVHREDIKELNTPLSKIMRGPPPYIATSTSIGRVIDLLLEKRYKMIIIVKPSNLYETGYSSSLKAVGVFTFDKLFKLTTFAPNEQEPYISQKST